MAEEEAAPSSNPPSSFLSFPLLRALLGLSGVSFKDCCSRSFLPSGSRSCLKRVEVENCLSEEKVTAIRLEDGRTESALLWDDGSLDCENRIDNCSLRRLLGSLTEEEEENGLQRLKLRLVVEERQLLPNLRLMIGPILRDMMN